MRLKSALALIGWNALWLLAGLTLIAIAGEVWLRHKGAFPEKVARAYFHPEAGRLREPGSEFRWTNYSDFWVISQVNSLGFLDREPVSPERAAQSCHVTMIGDSFTEAKEVSINDKFQVRLEALAAQELPHLDITTSAFGIGATGQVHQLGFYDEFARLMRPKLVVLVFVANDFTDNPTLLAGIVRRIAPDQLPWTFAARSPAGTLVLHAPSPAYQASSTATFQLLSWGNRIKEALKNRSVFADWLRIKSGLLLKNYISYYLYSWQARALQQDPRYAALLDGWIPPEDEKALQREVIRAAGTDADDLPPLYRDALEMNGFALDQFKERTERDNASLVVLATHNLNMSDPSGDAYALIYEMAAARDIPVIDQYDYILRQGGNPANAQWTSDQHWSTAGHQWAAEALLEYLKANPSVCQADLQ